LSNYFDLLFYIDVASVCDATSRLFYIDVASVCDATSIEIASSITLCHCRLRTDCAHYRTIADEAYRLLTDMRDRDALSQSQAGQLCDWLELVEEVCFVGCCCVGFVTCF